MENVDSRRRLNVDLEIEKRSGSSSRRPSLFQMLGLASSQSSSDKQYMDVTIHLYDGRKITAELTDKLTGHGLLDRIAYELGDQKKARYFLLIKETKKNKSP